MVRKLVKEYGEITIGILLVAFAVEYFFVPNNLAAGGVTGLAIVINNYIPILSTGILVLIMNLILFVIAFIFLGGNFGAKTIYTSFGLSIVMAAIEKYLKPQPITTDLIMATLFGTIISAIGMAIVFNVNASTGGTDIIAKILNKYFHINIGKSLLIVDFLVTISGAITFGIDRGLYALVCVILNGLAIDRFIEGFKVCMSVTIISEKYSEINEFILNTLERGCTNVSGIGGYTRKDIFIINTVLERMEFIKLKNYIKEIDPRAFITVAQVHEVLGEGFADLLED